MSLNDLPSRRDNYMNNNNGFNYHVAHPQRGGKEAMISNVNTMRLANSAKMKNSNKNENNRNMSLFNITQILLHIVKFLHVKNIISMRRMNHNFNCHLYFGFVGIKGIISFRYKHSLIKDIIEHEFGVSIKTLAKWFLVSQNHRTSFRVIHEIPSQETQNSNSTIRDDKSLYLFEVDVVDDVKDVMRGQGTNKWRGVFNYCRSIRLIVATRGPFVTSWNNSSWKQLYNIGMYQVFEWLNHCIKHIDNSIQAQEYEKFGNIGVC